MGGFYERMVQSVKRPLRKIIGRSNQRFEELNTVLIEVEAVINCRLLTFVYDDCEGVSYALTPSHLLYGRRMASLVTMRQSAQMHHSLEDQGIRGASLAK